VALAALATRVALAASGGGSALSYCACGAAACLVACLADAAFRAHGRDNAAEHARRRGGAPLLLRPRALAH
jgi:hypothetical protein